MQIFNVLILKVISIPLSRVEVNLIGMGILPLQFKPGESAESHGLSGHELFSIPAVGAGQKQLVVQVESDANKKDIEFDVRIDTANEFDYFSNGGILSYVIRNMLEMSS